MASNPLTDVLPAKARKIVYAVLFVASAAFTVWQATDGDWEQFAGGLVAALTSALAASNTPAPAGGEDGAADAGLLLLVGCFVGVVLLLCGIRLH